MTTKEIFLPTFPFQYAIKGGETIQPALTVLEDVELPKSQCRLLRIDGPMMDKKTPHLVYLLNQTLASHWHVLSDSATTTQLVGSLSCIGAACCIVPQISYPTHRSAAFKPPAILGWRMPKPKTATSPRVVGGVENTLAFPIKPMLNMLTVTIKAKGTFVVRCLAQLNLASDVQHDLFLASGDTTPDYVTTSMLLYDFERDAHKPAITANWLVFPRRAAAIIAAIQTLNVDAKVVYHAENTFSW